MLFTYWLDWICILDFFHERMNHLHGYLIKVRTLLFQKIHMCTYTQFFYNFKFFVRYFETLHSGLFDHRRSKRYTWNQLNNSDQNEVFLILVLISPMEFSHVFRLIPLFSSFTILTSLSYVTYLIVLKILWGRFFF